jgi:predicted glycosyltransferase
LKIWFDILTPKQILFFEPMVSKLQKNNTILCTSRNYREVTQLAKLKKMKLVFIGRHGGQSRVGKLDASLRRTASLARHVQRFRPDLTISFCSPEAARVSFGLGIRHIAFCDSPHAEAVMRLSVPLVQKLLIPWIIPKKEFTKYGISEKNIIPYRAIDAAVIVKHAKPAIQTRKQGKKNILIRAEEAQAAYMQKNQNHILKIVEKVSARFSDANVSVLPRYKSQIVRLRQVLGKRAKILDRVVVGSTLLQNTDVFVGSGGTMTAEAALFGIPTISYNAVPNLVQDYLVKRRLIVLQSDADKIVLTIDKMLRSDNKVLRKNAKNVLLSMEDPYKKLLEAIKTS